MKQVGQNFWKECFKKLSYHWKKCINKYGGYAEYSDKKIFFLLMLKLIFTFILLPDGVYGTLFTATPLYNNPPTIEKSL